MREMKNITIPPKTVPVMPIRLIMAIFIPWVMGASGAPKQVAHAMAMDGANPKIQTIKAVTFLMYTVSSAFRDNLNSHLVSNREEGDKHQNQ